MNKTIVVQAYEFGYHQFGDITAHVVCLEPTDARKLMEIQKNFQEIPSEVIYVACRALVYPLDFLKTDLEEVVGEDKAEEFYNSEEDYIILDGDPFGLTKGRFEAGSVFVFRKDIVSRYEDSESDSLQEAIKAIAEEVNHV